MKKFLQELKIYGIIITTYLSGKSILLLEIAALILSAIAYFEGDINRMDFLIMLSVILYAIRIARDEVLRELNESREYILDYSEALHNFSKTK